MQAQVRSLFPELDVELPPSKVLKIAHAINPSSDSTSLPLEAAFELEAESITATAAGFNLHHITLFRPTLDTMRRLKRLRVNEYMGPLRLIDKLDNGEEDVRLDKRHNYLVSVTFEENKMHTVVLSVKTTF